METYRAVLEPIMRVRRLLGNDPCGVTPCQRCYQQHAEKLEFFIRRRAQIHFVLPAFPSRSQSPAKVLSHLPDMGERLALQFLQDLCEEIRQVYPPGAWMTICSDGRVFVPVDGMTDEQVNEYHQELNDIITALNARDFDVFTLDHLFEGDNDTIREAFLERYARPLEEVQQLVRSGDPIVELYRGLTRFTFEELLTVRHGQASRNQLHKESKRLAYLLLQRSLAWSKLIKMLYPRSLRLSIHPQPAHSEKIRIQLMDVQDNWLTPWHGVAVRINHRFRLMKRYEAEALGGQLIYRDGRPSHYVIE